ncbi:MAG TPA: hypothetical protein VKE70_31040 [Candidatus Solibacter sp.]|nr:hypothetical protein [Candidatus Solibacter sp.]
MKLLAIAAIWTAGAAAQSLTVGEIMERVAHNQTRSQEARREFTYHQNQLLRMTRSGGKLAREEKREYDVTPAAHGFHKELAHFEGKYESKGRYVSYDRPGYTYKEMDIDGELIHEMSEEMTNDKQSRDGLSRDLFPLTEREQHKYNFQLLRKEPFRGHEVYRVKFEPKPHQEADEAAWKGEALIDAAEFQPVFVQTSLAPKIPMAVKVLLGTNIHGLGFAVSYDKFEDGIWFPVSYGGEFEVRAVFFYKRKISVSMSNTDFRRTRVNSSVTYVSQDR